MYITIDEFMDRPPQLLPNSSVLSYWVRFRANTVSGEALLAGTYIGQLRQRLSSEQIIIAVETGQKSVEGFRLLSSGDTGSYRFEALPHPGEYKLTGRVNSVLARSDGTVYLVSVWVGSCRFDLSSDDVGQARVAEGDWVEFRVAELALFDENL